MNLELFRFIILSFGWPILIVGGIYILLKSVKFNQELKKIPLGKIIISMTMGQLISMASLGIVATVFMMVNLKAGVYVVTPIFLIWFAAMIFVFTVSFKWSKEAAKINILYYKLKERAEEIKKEKVKLAQVASNMSTGTILLDSAGKVIFVNREAKNIAGFESDDEEEIYGAILGKFSEYSLKEKISECIKGKPSSIIDIKLDGKFYEIHLRNLVDQNKSAGDYFGHFIWLRDVTQEKVLAKAKNNFITVASHKLRTPVSGLKLLSENLLSDKSLNDNAREIVNEINKSSTLLTGLVNNIIQNIDYDTKEIQVKHEKCDFRKIANDLVDYYRKENDNKCQINFSCDKNEFYQVTTDKNLLKKVIKIVIKNALIYNKVDCVIDIKLSKHDNQAVFSVADSGIGVPEEARTLIFSNFYRADNAIKKYTEGTGTNLCIAKQIIASLGGKIWFESILDKGSVFYISLPLTEK